VTLNEQAQRLQAMLQPLPVTATLLPATSRYYTAGTAVLDADGERPVLYLLRRFVPRPERLIPVGEHVVEAGQRTDHIAASALGDPELFWRICDANRAVFAEDLVREPGRRLRVTMPETGGAP
jgi:hypothetical protein